MLYIIYQTTNKINGKVYVGAHKTENLNDEYLGSGSALKQALAKYGKGEFERETIHICENEQDMYAKEAEIVTKEFVSRSDTYNLQVGGSYRPELLDRRVDWTRTGREQTNKILREKYGEDWRTILAKKANSGHTAASHKAKGAKAWDTKLKRYGHGTFKGKHHTDETKRKIGQANSKHQRGKKNSQHGTCWIYSIEKQINKSIPKSELQLYINSGWQKGRKMEFYKRG